MKFSKQLEQETLPNDELQKFYKKNSAAILKAKNEKLRGSLQAVKERNFFRYRIKKND